MKENQHFVLAPSILSANLAELGKSVTEVIAAGADWLHFDVMDNHYVPNLSFGPCLCKALRNYNITAAIDVHLMTAKVDELVVSFAEAGASSITFHPEASLHIDRTIDLIHKHNMQAGLALNPGTSEESLKWLLSKLDIILIMAVNPGFSGQKFIPYTIEKIKKVRQLIDDSQYKIQLMVDGGITIDNIEDVAKAGANIFVAGSAIFNADDPIQMVKSIKNRLSLI